MVTSDIEDSAIEAIGGEFAATYGEITEVGFRTLAERVSLGADDSFVDCGSGLGRAVVQAAREFGVARSCGVEFAASRHRLAQVNLQREAASASTLAERVSLFEGDCADSALWRSHLSRSTVAFAANLLFDEALNGRLKRCIEECGSELRCVASLKAWPDGLDGFREPCEVRCETSWSAPLVLVGSGKNDVMPHEGTTVYVYERSCDGDGVAQ